MHSSPPPPHASLVNQILVHHHFVVYVKDKFGLHCIFLNRVSSHSVSVSCVNMQVHCALFKIRLEWIKAAIFNISSIFFFRHMEVS